MSLRSQIRPYRKLLTITIVGVMVCLSIGCNKNTIKEEPELYEPSELALLMRKMEAENIELRKAILSGTPSDSLVFPSAYVSLTEAKPTTAGTINAEYKAHANAYKLVMQRLQHGSGDMITKYNVGIQSCINCHSSFCNGPIPRIEKLFIPTVVN